MVKNDYQDMGREIEAELAAKAAQADKEGNEAAADTAKLEMAKKKHGDKLFQLPASDLVNEIGMGDLPEDQITFIDSLDPEARRQMFEDIAASDGLGSVKQYMDGGIAAFDD